EDNSYGRFNDKSYRSVRAIDQIHSGESKLDMALTSDMMGPALDEEYPEVESFARLFTATGAKLMKKGDRWVNEAKVAHADSSFFHVFSYSALHGELAHALDRSEEHTSELQSRENLVCRLLLEKK